MSPRTNNASGKKLKKKKSREPAKKFIFTVVKFLLVFIIALSCAGIGIVGGSIYGYIKTASPITPEQLQLKSTSFVLDVNGVEMAQLKGLENRQQVDFNEIPKNLKTAFVAIEDKNFYNHSGIDLRRFVGAVINYVLKAGNSSYGGSTITMQLVKNLTSDNDRSIKRKVQEQYRAIQLESKLTKNQILERYLNTIPMGGHYYGVQAASKAYFNKDVSELSLAECASIAAIPNLSTYYSPATQDGRENNKRRQELILSEMLRQGKITQKEYDQSMQETLAATTFTDIFIALRIVVRPL